MKRGIKFQNNSSLPTGSTVKKMHILSENGNEKNHTDGRVERGAVEHFLRLLLNDMYTARPFSRRRLETLTFVEFGLRKQSSVIPELNLSVVSDCESSNCRLV